MIFSYQTRGSFILDVLSQGRCLARVWGLESLVVGNVQGGLWFGTEVCMLHNGDATFCRSELRQCVVAGEIPRSKILGFVSFERKREDRVFAVATAVQRAKHGRKLRARKFEKI